MATYVLVHGGGHGGWCYQRVARILRAQGHDVSTPTLTGLGERAHLLDDRVDLDRHVADVAAVLRFEDLHDVILVGHSYGGMVITGDTRPRPVAGRRGGARDQRGAADGRGCRRDRAGPAPGPRGGDALRGDGPGRPGLDGRAADAPPVDVLRAATPARKRGCAVGHPTIPHRLHLDTGDARRDQMARARADGRLWDIDTGHDLMITEPERTAGALLQVAAA